MLDLAAIASPAPSRRAVLRAGAALAALGATAGCGSNPDAVSKPTEGAKGVPDSGQVVVRDGGGAWGDAQRKAFFEPFQKETGIKVVPAPSGGQPQLRAAIVSGKPGMDVADVGGANIGAFEQEGLLQKIDYARWKDPSLREKFAPFKAGDLRVPSIIFAVQLAYDERAVGKPLQSWADFWNTRDFPGKRSLHAGDSPGGAVYEICLLADGVKPDKLYPLDMPRALKKLTQLKPDILKFWASGAESVQLLIDKQVAAVAAWNGRIDTAVTDGAKNVQSNWNQAILQVDYWAIPRGATNVPAAQRFIEFACRPDRQAEFATLISYAPSLPAAYDLIPKERRGVLVTAPEHKDQIVQFDPEFWASKNAEGKTMNDVAGELWQKWLTT
jgi:putative spermidine/putrescine transport system substrate-binding protein